MNYGLIMGVVGVIWNVMLYSMDAHTSRDTANTVIGLVITIAIITWGIWAFRKANGGYLSLGQAVKLGMGMALVSGIIAVLYTILMAHVIDPDYIKDIAEAQKAAAEAQGTFTSEQIEQQYQGTLDYFWFSYPVILIFSVLIGLVVGLIDGLILKKAKPDY